MPLNRTMHFLNTFYIFGREEAPNKDVDTTAPFVRFSQVVLHSTTNAKRDEDMLDYDGVQLALLKFNDFFQLVNKSYFCCLPKDVGKNCEREGELFIKAKQARQTYNDIGIYNFTVPFGEARRKMNIQYIRPANNEPVTGIYVLAVTNCGDFQDATLDGTIVVKHPYGYLPGNEYHKLPFYGWLSMAYTTLALVWTGLTLRWWRETVAIQNCITVTIFLGLLECFLWWNHYNDWNLEGYRSRLMYALALLASVVKNIFSYMLILVASLGWGVSRQYLDPGIMRRIKLLTVVYIVLDVLKEVVVDAQNSQEQLPAVFVLLCLLPVSLLNGVIFYWVFAALSNLIESLKDRRQEAKLQVFRRLWGILVLALTIATLTQLYHIFHVPGSYGLGQWRDEWLYSDGISHLLFFAVLASIMYLWAPHKHSQRYAYNAVEKIGDENEEHKRLKTVTWTDEDEEDDEETFWNAAHHAEEASGKAKPVARPEPTKLGVSALQETMADLDKMVGEDLVGVEKTS